MHKRFTYLLTLTKTFLHVIVSSTLAYNFIYWFIVENIFRYRHSLK